MSKTSANFAVIGLSGRGSGMLGELLEVPGVKVVAVCDLYEDRAQHGVEIVKEKTGVEPAMYLDYKQLLARDDIDAVMCSTTWISHARIAIDAMRAGKNVAVEVGGAASIDECWQMVHTSEETGKFCMLLENCCYDRYEMAVFNMVKQGLFGEIVHLEGGYRHDLRDEIAHGKENRHGRLKNFMHRNGELYPTHQLGPICKLININRGNRMVTLSSMASKARGLSDWIAREHDKDYYLNGYPFNEGDVVTTMIKCANGETITLHHDCTLPRPYSRDYLVQGTRGIYSEGVEDCGHVLIDDGDSANSWNHEWQKLNPTYLEKYEHPLWKGYDSENHGHGGMDYLVLSAFVDAVLNGTEPPIDVYDTAAWMAITCLSEESVALGSMPVAIPDFTNGQWIDREPSPRSKYCLEEICEEFFED